MTTTPYPFVAAQVLTASELNSTFNIPVNTKTVSYILVAGDAGKRIVMNSASATTITVNTSLFSAGDNLEISNISTGVCTVTAGTATVSSAGPLAIPQHGSGTLYFTSAGVSTFFPSAVTVSSATPGLVAIVPTSVAVGSGSATVSTNGLVTASACTSVSLNGVFSATYTNYRLTVNTTSTAGSTNMRLRLRVGGTDTTSSTYKSQKVYASGAGITAAASTTTGFTNDETGRLDTMISGDIFNPFTVTTTLINTLWAPYNVPTDFASGFVQGVQTGSTSFDGITLYGTGGDISGNVIVMGYNQ